jgi:hypothetical protein
MIEKRALPQQLINFTFDNATESFDFDDAVDIKGDLQPIGSAARVLQMFGLDNVAANSRINFVPIRYAGSFSDNFLLGGAGQSLILKDSQYYEVTQIAPWSGHYVVLCQPWTGVTPS